jgi:hypothetical protein
LDSTNRTYRGTKSKSREGLSIDIKGIFRELAEKSNIKNGLSIKELSDETGMSREWVRLNLEKIGAKFLGTRRIKDRCGKNQNVPVYGV